MNPLNFLRHKLRNKAWRQHLLLGIICIGLLFLLFYARVVSHPNSSLSVPEGARNLQEDTIIGHSMFPTFKNGEKVLVDYQGTDFGKGDVVVFRFKTRTETFVKRIIAVGGDEVVFGKDGFLYINGEKLEEPYVNKGKSFKIFAKLKLILKQLEYYDHVIPENMMLVMGDNRGNSFDSTQYGLVLRQYLIGRVYKRE